MDFENDSWDVATEAEKLHQSLFGDTRIKQQNKVKKGRKRKHTFESHDVGPDVTDDKINKKIKSDKNEQTLEYKTKSKSLKRKDKTFNLDHNKKETDKESNVFTGEGGTTTNEGIQKKSKIKTTSSERLAVKNDVGSFEPGQNVENNVGKKKKKRKRKCKKNKFKDYSKPSEDEKKNNEIVSMKTIHSGVNDTEKSKGETSYFEVPDENKSSKIGKKQKKKLKREKGNAISFTFNSAADNFKEKAEQLKDKEVSIPDKDHKLETKQKKKKKHKSGNEGLSNGFNNALNIQEEKVLQVKQGDLSGSENNSEVQSKQNKKKKHKLKRENKSSSEGNPENGAKNSKMVTYDKNDSQTYTRNQLDPLKLQAILKSKSHIKSEHLPDKSKTSFEGQSSGNDSSRANKDMTTASESFLEKSKKRLNAARFRYLNEQLYTTTGSDAFQMFRKDKEAFQVYHDGFQGQVEKWPVNPVSLIIDFIKSKPKYLVVADFGCGDAKIAQSVPNKVHSFDLVALNNHVTVCDMAKVPLKDTSIDIAVFCLSLMGTNLSSYLKEANRVLRQNGILKIAEVTSRFPNVGKFILEVEKIGFKVLNQDTSNKMFVLMDFRKASPQKLSSAEIRLDPCVYKKR